jgi:hypothetical protein
MKRVRARKADKNKGIEEPESVGNVLKIVRSVPLQWDGVGSIFHLNLDILRFILGMLGWREVVALQRTSKYFYYECTRRLNEIALSVDMGLDTDVFVSEVRRVYYCLFIRKVGPMDWDCRSNARCTDTYGLPRTMVLEMRGAPYAEIDSQPWNDVIVAAINLYRTFERWNERIAELRAKKLAKTHARLEVSFQKKKAKLAALERRIKHGY